MINTYEKIGNSIYTRCKVNEPTKNFSPFPTHVTITDRGGNSKHYNYVPTKEDKERVEKSDIELNLGSVE
ncbi:hypothetical protein HNV12_04165 [Methanococcoides sp. SA1]|nr:hypothetical protein [Methanococcoides sp. SA1]